MTRAQIIKVKTPTKQQAPTDTAERFAALIAKLAAIAPWWAKNAASQRISLTQPSWEWVCHLLRLARTG